VSGLTLAAFTQPWFVLRVAGAGPARTVQVAGDVAAGGLAGLGLAGLALVGALAIAGPVIRVVLGVLQVLLGGTTALSAAVAVADPVAAGAAAVTEATGESGVEAVRRITEGATATVWPYSAAVLGVAGAVLGVVIAVTSRHWPGSPRKYRAVGLRAEDGGAPVTGGRRDPADVEAGGPDAVADWDALSDGSDPTSR